MSGRKTIQRTERRAKHLHIMPSPTLRATLGRRSAFNVMAGYSSLASTCGKPFYGWRTLTYHDQYGAKLSVLTNQTEGKRQDKFSEWRKTGLERIGLYGRGVRT